MADEPYSEDPPLGSPGLPFPPKRMDVYAGGTKGFNEQVPSAKPPDAFTTNTAPTDPPSSGGGGSWWDSTGPKALEPTTPDGTGGLKGLPPVETPTPAGGGSQPSGKDLETQWINFTNELSGYKGSGGAFDPTQGRTGGSSAATSARGNVGSLVDQYNQKFGAQAKAVGEDKIDFGDGRGPVDVIRDAGNGQSGFWFDEGGGGGGTGGGGGGGGPAPPGPGPTLTPAPAPGPLPQGYVPPTAPPVEVGNWQGTTPGQGSALYDTLMKRAGQSLSIDPNDPIIRNQADAHSAQLGREKSQYLQGLAERGGSNANISAESRAASERAGQGSADFESALMGRELDARRSEIQDALHGAQGLLTSEQQLQLQGELAKMNAVQEQYRFGAGQGQQESQFTRGLGQRESEFARTLAQAESQFGRQLTQTEKQLLQRQFEFNQSQGQQESQFGRDLSQRGYEFDVNDRFRNSPLYGG